MGFKVHIGLICDGALHKNQFRYKLAGVCTLAISFEDLRLTSVFLSFALRICGFWVYSVLQRTAGLRLILTVLGGAGPPGPAF